MPLWLLWHVERGCRSGVHNENQAWVLCGCHQLETTHWKCDAESFFYSLKDDNEQDRCAKSKNIMC